MSLTETLLPDRKDQNQSSGDVYDDGFLRVRTQKLLCGMRWRVDQASSHRVFDFLPFSSFTGRELCRGSWEHAWGQEKPLNTESLHVYIYRLQSKLVPYNLRIDTMVNVGYRLLLDRAPQA